MQKISIEDLLQKTGYKNITLNYLAPFADEREIAVTLHYSGGKEETYTVELTSENQSKVIGWIMEAVNK